MNKNFQIFMEEKRPKVKLDKAQTASIKLLFMLPIMQTKRAGGKRFLLRLIISYINWTYTK